MVDMTNPDGYSRRCGIGLPDRGRLRQLDGLDPAALITTLLDPTFRLRDLLDAEDIPDDVFTVLASVMRRMATVGDAAQHSFLVMGLLNMTLSSQLLIQHVPTFLQRTAAAGSITSPVLADLVTVFQKMLDRFPAKASESLGIALAACRDAVSRSMGGHVDESIEGALQSLEETRRTVLRRYDSVALRRVVHDETAQVVPPPDNFRRMSVTITAADVHQVAHPFLRPNVMDGRFVDVEHYLDVHFRLLREDFVAPLRDSIDNLLSTLQLHPTLDMTEVGRDARIHVYTDVRNDGCEASYSNGIAYRFRFDTRRLGRINWHDTKRLLHGSLVCLSADNFHSFYLAVIVDRDPDNLKRGLLVVRMVNDGVSSSWNATSRLRFTMVESPTFYQAYEPVLRRLQTLNAARLPFQRNIVECRADLLMPRYMEEGGSYNLEPLLLGSHWASSHFYSASDWPPADYFGLDEAQYAALKLALTKELAIIQGPPGTGKTFLGLKIAEALLANERLWRGNCGNRNPILVICYTNHALDQFLEGILKLLPTEKWENWLEEKLGYNDSDYDDVYYDIDDEKYKHRRFRGRPRFNYNDDMVPILRVGGQSKNPTVARYGLSTVRRLAIECWSTKEERHFNWLQREQLNNISIQIKEREQIIQISNTDLMEDSVLVNYMKQEHREQLDALRDSLSRQQHGHGGVVSTIADWLGLADALLETDETPLPPASVSKKSPTMTKRQDEPEQLTDDDTCADEEDFSSKVERQRLKDKNAVRVDDSNENSEGQFRSQRGNRKSMRRKITVNLSAGATMSLQEMMAVSNIWQLDPEDRWRLYRYWVLELQEHIQAAIRKMKTNFTALQEDLQRKQRVIDTRIFRNTKVVGMTTTGAAKYKEFLQEIQPRIIIVEEAAEVLEAHIISALTEGCQHLILIGDHQQLRPNPSVYKLATKYHLDVSLFERLIRNGVSHVTLTQQHRMRPEISALLVPHIYSNLADHPSVRNRAHVAGVATSVFFLNHNHEESAVADSTSHANEFEARFALALANYLLQQGQYHSSEIVLLTTYVGQLNLMKRLIWFEGSNDVRDVLCTVVDNYQGEENKIIILSLVRNNEEGNVGFLRVDNRVCVALSRARDGLYCIGNFNGLAKASPLWKNIVESLRRRPLPAIGDRLPIACQLHPETAPSVSDGSDFAHLAPDGGCCHPCQSFLACGLHQCPKSCHPFDVKHEHIKCQVICEKVLCESQHVCGKPCYIECGDCHVQVSKLLPLCGHLVNASCSAKPNEITCSVLVSKELICGHVVEAPCGGDWGKIACTMWLEKELGCGHAVKLRCVDDPTLIVCQILVTKKLPCDHTIKIACGTSDCDLNSIDCQLVLERELECGHTVKANCGNDSTKQEPLCEIPVQKELLCGHTCEAPCHVDISTIFCRVLLQQKELKCGHTALSMCGIAQSAIVCRARVEKNLPCGHTLKAECNVDARTIFCRILGNKELECGHVASAMCGVDKENIVCRIPSQKQLTCGHFTEAECNTSIRRIVCQAVVEKKLHCGHMKEAQCTIDPGHISCNIPIVKQLECGHSVEMPCRPFPSVPLQCMLPCTKLLSCGHPCTDICNIRCYKVRCQLKVEIARACGHQAQVACHEATSTDLKALKIPCNTPCEATLTCGHRCGGSCGECYGGRLHKRCNEMCSRSLLCGHNCPLPCWRSCPPCQQPCPISCEHGSKCESSCGMPCQLTCEMTCGRRCEHSACSRPCQELCDSAPCNVPCPLKLPSCGHPCAGLCGEQCPPCCRACEREVDAAIPSIDALSDRDGGAEGRLVVLQDCGHVFEVDYLDGWMGVAIATTVRNSIDDDNDNRHITETTTEHNSTTTPGQDSTGSKSTKTFTSEHEASTNTTDSNATTEQDVISLTANEITNQDGTKDKIVGYQDDDNNKPNDQDLADVNTHADNITTTNRSAKETTEVNAAVTGATINSVVSTSRQEVAVKCCPRCGIAIRHSRRYGNQIKHYQASVLEVKKRIFEDVKLLKSELVDLASSKSGKTLSATWSNLRKEVSGPRSISEMVVLHHKFRSLVTIDTNVTTLLVKFLKLKTMEEAWRQIFPSVSLLPVITELLRRLKTYMQSHLDCRETSETQLHDFGRELWRFTLLVRLVCSLDYKSRERLLEVKPQLDLLYVVLVGRQPFSDELERLVIKKWESARGDVGSSLLEAAPPNSKFSDGLTMCGGRWFKCQRGHLYHVSEGRCAACVSLICKLE